MRSYSTAPWEVRQAPAINSVDYDIHQKGVPASAGKIARIYGREGRQQMTIANARLVAAAPELLDALEGVVRAINNYEDISYEVISAAIAKARGEVSHA